MKPLIYLGAVLALGALALFPPTAGVVSAQNPQPCASVQNSATKGQVLSAQTAGRTPVCRWITGSGGGGSGTVTSITATSPIVVTPSPITTTGVISCPTCSTSSGPSITQGTFASLPGTCATSDLYIFTSGYYELARCSATNTWTTFFRGHSATPPAACASWTVVNVATGTAACANSGGAIVLSTTSSVSGGYESALIATPAAPYIRTFAVSYFNLATSGATAGAACGVAYTNGTTNSSAVQGIFSFSDAPSSGTPAGFRVQHSTDYTQATFTNDSSNFPLGVNGPFVYFQLEDDNATKFFRVSTNGVSFVTIFSVARTTNFTPTNMGIFCSGGASGASLPWSETLMSLNAGAQ